MKKYYIVARTFYPENNPRAFRTFELLREISKYRKVELIIKDRGYDYFDIEKKYGIKINKINKTNRINRINNSSNKNLNISRIKNNFLKKISKIFNYFFADKDIFYTKKYYDYIKNNIKEEAVVISIGLPILTHIASAFAKIKNKNIKSLVLDYGDPFYFNKYSKHAIYFYYIEKLVLKQSNLVLLPLDAAKKSFEKFNLNLKFLISPQGVNLNDFLINEYKQNKIPTFSYAGIFYKKLRNPKKLLDFLTNYPGDFKFILFGVKDSAESMEILKPYLEKLGKKIELRDKLNRKECIFELSKMDFLINVDNLNLEQRPSKLIDYSLSKRPVYSFNQENFSEEKFQKFLQNDYSEKMSIDIKEYDVEIITNKLIEEIEKIFLNERF